MRNTDHYEIPLRALPVRRWRTAPPRLLPLAVAFSLGLTGCGGGDGGVTPEPSPLATSISISSTTLVLTFLGEVTRLTASVLDQEGQPFNTSITWSVGDPGVATVSSSGDVTAVGNGTTTVNASAGSVSTSLTVTVQQVATQVTVVSGDGQTGTVGAALAAPLVAQSSDAGGAAVANVAMSFAVSAGGGTLSTTSVTSGVDGRASTTWTLGTELGAQRVEVSIQGVSGGTATFSAEANTTLVSGIPVEGLSGTAGSEMFFTIDVPAAAAAPPRDQVASSIQSGVGLQKFASARSGLRTVASPAPAAAYTASAAISQLRITLSGGTGDPDLFVSFGAPGESLGDWDCVSQGPSTEEACVFFEPAPGTYHIRVLGWDDFSGVTLLGTISESSGPFQIDLEFINRGTASQDAAFLAAAVRWMSIVRGDVPDFDFSTFPLAADDCTDGSPAFSGVVDDLLIYVDIVAIDGPFGTLAEAGPCYTRGGSSFPIMGSMQFDQADLARLESDGDMLAVVLHEMGHVLGIGVLWETFGLVQNPSLPSNQGADTHFTGPLAIAAFDAAGGTGYTGGAKVPVENQLGEGSGDTHWREDPVGHELMTPSLNSGQTNPLSAISIQSLADMGYVVDVSQADPYSRVFTSPARAPALGARMIDLSNDIRRGPIKVVDEGGRVIREIRR